MARHDAFAWGPGMAFVSVSGIVLGSLWLLEGLAEPIRIYIARPGPIDAVYSQTPLGVWRWCSLACGMAAGALALTGGIAGVFRNSSARRALGAAAVLAALGWAGDLIFWGAWAMGAWDSGVGPHGGVLYSPYPYYGSMPNVELKGSVIAALIVSSMTTLAWVITTFIVLRRRQAIRVETAEALPALAAAAPPESSVATLSYHAPQTRAERRTPISLQASAPVARALFVLAIVLGILVGLQERAAFNATGQQGAWRFILGSRRAPASAAPALALAVHALDLAGALMLLLGGILGTLRRVGAGRVLVFCGVSVLFFGEMALFQIQMSGEVASMLGTSGHVQWMWLCTQVGRIIRSQAYAIICFVALSRAPQSSRSRLG